MIIIGGAIIAGCIYVFGKERQEKQQQRVRDFAEKLHAPASPAAMESLTITAQLSEMFAPILSGKDSEKRKIILTDEKQIEEEEVEKSLQLSKVMMGLSLASLFFPPLRIVALGGLIYASKGIYEDGFKSVKAKKVDSSVMDAIAITGILGTGHLVLGAIGDILFFSGKKYLLKTEDRSAEKMVNLFGEQPKSVWLVINDETEIEIPFERLERGAVISVYAGGMIPVDGLIVKGYALVNQQALTGESQPVEKKPGDTCFAATVVLEGRICIQVTEAGIDTVAAQIGEILRRSVDFKEVMISKGKNIADRSSLPILVLAAASVPFFGVVAGTTIVTASFGFILKLVSPMMVLNFLTITSQEGILVKDGRSLERLSKVDTIVFDKTGTLTEPQPHVGKIHTLNGLSENELLAYTAAAEYRQTHPIALAILQEAKERQLELPETGEAQYEIGYGIKVTLYGKIIHVGSARFMESVGIAIPETVQEQSEAGHQLGYTFVYVAIGGELQGIFELHPTIRPEAKAVIEELQASGKQCYIISGDHENPTRHLAAQLGISHYFSEVLPEEKANLVGQLQAQNKTVCFVGDGINDAIALKKADVSISLNGASTIATDTAQVVLMTESLRQIPLLFTIGEQFNDHMNKNIIVSVAPAALVICGVFLLNFGIVAAIIGNEISLMAGVANAVHPMLTYQQAKKKRQQLEKTATAGKETLLLPSPVPQEMQE